MIAEEMQDTPEPRLPEHFVRWWVFRTVISYILGIFIIIVPLWAIVIFGSSFNFNNNLIRTLSAVWTIAAIPIYGAFVGYIQWEDQLLDFLSRKSWMIASAISAIIGPFSLFLVLILIPQPLSSPIIDNQTLYIAWFVIILVWSFIIGTGISIPFWVVLSRKGYWGSWIIAASVGGVLTAFTLMTILGLFIRIYIPVLYELFCTAPPIVGAAIGLTLKKILRKNQHFEQLGKCDFEIGICWDWLFCSIVV
jgi:hypothetical protein